MSLHTTRHKPDTDYGPTDELYMPTLQLICLMLVLPDRVLKADGTVPSPTYLPQHLKLYIPPIPASSPLSKISTQPGIQHGIMLKSVRHFITQGNYKATCFDYRFVILRPILSIVSQDAMHTLGSHRVFCVVIETGVV